MTALTTLPSKISKTKKRLSDGSWYLPIITITIMGLCAVFAFALRAASLAPRFGMIEAEIPVLVEPLSDPGFHRREESAETTIADTTPVIVLTTQAFYFGNLKAFSADFYQTRNKFYISHIDGSPQLTQLLETMAKWQARSNRQKHNEDSIVIFAPTGDIPSPIVIQVIAGLRQSSLFQRVVLANGLI